MLSCPDSSVQEVDPYQRPLTDPKMADTAIEMSSATLGSTMSLSVSANAK
jgi:hypothetical protein